MNAPTLRQNQSTCAKCPHSQRPCAGKCVCKESGIDITVHQRQGDCPLSLFPAPLPDGAPLPDPKPRTKARAGAPCGSPEKWGPQRWAVLHATAARGELTGRKLETFIQSLPCRTCRADFAAAVESDPLPADPADQPRWSWRQHDRIRRKLEQPVVSLEEAAARWGWKL